MERKCSNCVYVYSRPGERGIDYDCRRYPPIPIHVDKPKKYKTNIYYQWPAVKYNHWCGEFKDASQPDK